MKAMKRLDIIIRPEKLEKLKEILEKKDYSGMTVFTAMGCGYQDVMRIRTGERGAETL